MKIFVLEDDFSQQNLPNSSILLKRFTISKRPQDPIVLFSIPRQTGWNLQRV